MYVFEWTVTLFAGVLPLPIASRIWDYWLLQPKEYNQIYWLKICISLCDLLYSSSLKNCKEREDVQYAVKAVGEVVTEKDLFNKLQDIKITLKEYEKAKSEILAIKDLERI